jgi:uncharacterized protein (TIGR03118 family)
MRNSILSMILITSAAQAAFGFSTGPPARRTAAPGDSSLACTVCHVGTALNGGAGSVKITLAGAATYTGGVMQHIQVTVSDPDQQRWGFQLSARLKSDPANGRAGDLLPGADGFTHIRCDSGNFDTCKDGEIQFIEHTQPGTRIGTPKGATFDFDWMPPAAGSGTVTLYVAGNAANGNGALTGDHIYTSNVQLTEAVVVTPVLTVPVTKYAVHNLVSDVAGADVLDANLVNPWGIALSPTSPFWISDNGSSLTTLYNTVGTPFPAASPIVAKVPGGPTGQIFNGTPGFALQPGKPASFIFSTESGTIMGWASSVDAANAGVLYDNSGSGAVYKGLALGANASGPVLYAANFNAGTIDAYDANMSPLATAGGFADPNLPAGFAPFNIQKFGRSLYVTYAMQDDAKHDDVRAAGNGYINVFDMDGNLRKRLVAGGALNSPWGLAIAPGFFGDYSGTLLVGNFGDGTINSYDPVTGDWIGALQDKTGSPLVIEGLWGLIFGNGKANGGDANTLYFTAGISGGGSVEDHGLFGSIGIAPAN